MKILLLNPFFWPFKGGIEWHVKKLAELLSKKHEVTVITSHTEGEPPREGYEVEVLEHKSYYVPILSPPPFVVTPKVEAALRRRAREFDLLHLHTRWFPDYVQAAVRVAREFKKPLFFTAHEPANVDIRPSMNFFGWFYNRWITKPLLRTANLLPVSQAVADSFKKEFGKETTEVVYNGVDTKFFSPNTRDKSFLEEYSMKKPYILFCGRMVRQKGLDYLLEAMKIVLREYPELQLVLVSRGAEEESLRRQAVRLGISRNVRFLNEYVPYEQLVSAYRNCEFFVLPSVWEAFGIVAIEAMSCGKTVVGSNTGGIPEVVGDTGLIVEPRDVDGLSSAIIRLMSDAKLLKRLGAAARRRVLANFTWGRTVERTVRGYNKVLNQTF